MTTPNLSVDKDLTVVREGKTIIFTPTAFKKGPNKTAGVKYPGLELTWETIPSFLEWMGSEDAVPWFNRNVAQLCIGVYNAATKNGAQDWNEEDNRSMLEKLSTRGESVKAIQEKIASLIREMQDPDLMLNLNSADVQVKMSAMTKFAGIASSLNKFQTALDSKKRVKTDDEDEDETDTQPAVVNA